MLKEALEHWLTPCPRRWRKMGYLREQIAIDARLRRNLAAWSPHLEATKREIDEAAARCEGRRCVLVLGGGLHHDIPMGKLAERFERVVLADLVHRPSSRRAARRVSERIVSAVFDASGVANRVFEESANMGDDALVAAVAEAKIGLPAECGGEPDLVVSASLCSQLLLLPVSWAERHRAVDKTLTMRLTEAGVRRHLEWLEERSGNVLLVSDFERRHVAPDESLVSVEAIPGMAVLRPPDRSWNWRLAPIPEFSRSQHLEHRVCVWHRAPLVVERRPTAS